MSGLTPLCVQTTRTQCARDIWTNEWMAPRKHIWWWAWFLCVLVYYWCIHIYAYRTTYNGWGERILFTRMRCTRMRLCVYRRVSHRSMNHPQIAALHPLAMYTDSHERAGAHINISIVCVRIRRLNGWLVGVANIPIYSRGSCGCYVRRPSSASRAFRGCDASCI